MLYAARKMILLWSIDNFPCQIQKNAHDTCKMHTSCQFGYFQKNITQIQHVTKQNKAGRTLSQIRNFLVVLGIFPPLWVVFAKWPD